MTSLNQFLEKLNNNVINSNDLFKTYDKSKIVNNSEIINNLNNVINNFNNYINDLILLKKHLTNEFYDEELKLQYKEVMEKSIIKHKNKEPEKKYQILENIDGVNLQGNKLKIPIVNNLREIPPMFYWYRGDNIYKKGIYVCIGVGFYARVPMPDVICSENSKSGTLRCKYETRPLCDLHKKKIAELYNSELRVCNYVHKKEHFNKVSNIYRCENENVGNHNTLDEDLNALSNFDVKHILMYSLSDDILSLIWYQNKFKNGDLILTTLDTY